MDSDVQNIYNSGNLSKIGSEPIHTYDETHEYSASPESHGYYNSFHV